MAPVAWSAQLLRYVYVTQKELLGICSTLEYLERNQSSAISSTRWGAQRVRNVVLLSRASEGRATPGELILVSCIDVGADGGAFSSSRSSNLDDCRSVEPMLAATSEANASRSTCHAGVKVQTYHMDRLSLSQVADSQLPSEEPSIARMLQGLQYRMVISGVKVLLTDLQVRSTSPALSQSRVV